MEYGWFGYSAEMVETPISVVVVSEGADASNFALVNVNTADETLLETLPRIGPTLAKQIVEYRETHGTFRSIEELKSVKGIGEKVLEDIRPYITIES
jgi:competence protein ComEA